MRGCIPEYVRQYVLHICISLSAFLLDLWSEKELLTPLLAFIFIP